MRKTISLICLVTAIALRSFADGLDTWTKVSTTPYGSFSHMVYGNAMFAANSRVPYLGMSQRYTNGLSVSSDGINWNHIAVFDFPSGLDFGNGVFAKSGWDPGTDGDAGFVYGATNAAGLTNLNLNNVFNGQYGLTYGTATYFSGINQLANGLFVSVGHLYESDVGTINTSIDGQKWTQQAPPASDLFLDGVAYNGSRFIAVGYRYLMPPPGPARVLTSTDGTNWTQVSSNLTASLGRLTDIRYVHNGCYATSISTIGSTNHYFTSSGTSWSLITPPFPSIWIPVTSTNGLYVSINSANGIYTSMDAASWTLRNTGITNQLTCISFDGYHLVAGSADGSIFRSGSVVPSLNGQLASTNGGLQLTLTGGVAGQSYQLQASTNLSTWSNLFTFTNVAAANQFLDATATNYPRRYYRTVTQ